MVTLGIDFGMLPMHGNISTNNRALRILLFGVLLLASCAPEAADQTPSAETEEEWVSLFNGKTLDGWVVKIAGHELGDNYGETYRVEDGLLKVSYDQYGDFGRQFGSLFYQEPFSHYRLRAEYRFVGDQAAGGPEWGFRDSGIQLHSPPPEMMTTEQEFPISVEMNLIGNGDTGARPTGNVCTPGTHIMMHSALFTTFCSDVSTQTVLGDEWATAEIEVHGNDSIKHFINGNLIVEYSQPHLDAASSDAQRLLAAGADTMLHGGYISLQSNSHPIEFRSIELLVLDPADAAN